MVSHPYIEILRIGTIPINVAGSCSRKNMFVQFSEMGFLGTWNPFLGINSAAFMSLTSYENHQPNSEHALEKCLNKYI